MTISEVRFYIKATDPEVALRLNKTHFGFSVWFGSRILRIRASLKGPEVKGVNILNFSFYDCKKPELRGLGAELIRLLNAIECSCRINIDQLILRDPIENIKDMMPAAAMACKDAAWPQVRAIGQALSLPLSQGESQSLQAHLKAWERHCT